jgi:hypothetical protein
MLEVAEISFGIQIKLADGSAQPEALDPGQVMRRHSWRVPTLDG